MFGNKRTSEQIRVSTVQEGITVTGWCGIDALDIDDK
jgi:hypothetical protein